MPGLTSRHQRGAFRPLVRQPPFARLVTGIERGLKGALFGCRMCGNCLLLETGFICPMTCLDGLRNGPCLDSPPRRCFSSPSSRCTWYDIYHRADLRDDLDRLLEIIPPLDSQRVGCETTLTAIRAWRCAGYPRLRDLLADPERFRAEWEAFRYELRQPSWWRGDRVYHPPAYTRPASLLELTLRRGEFAVIAGVASPPDSDPNRLAQVADRLKGRVHAITFVPRPAGIPSMSPSACAAGCLRHRLEPILPLRIYGRDRYAIEEEAIGAAALGVRNILCLLDKAPRRTYGPPSPPRMNDLDPAQALWMLRRLRDEGVDIDGRPVRGRPRYFLGAVTAPFALAPRYEAVAVEKKINAGAQFLQTLPVFDLGRFVTWLEALDQRDLLGKAHLIVTVMLLSSAQEARFLAQDLPGLSIPESFVARLEDAVDPVEEGVAIALELISEIRRIGAVRGLHLLAPHREDVIPRVLSHAGLGAVHPAASFSGNGRNGTSAHPIGDAEERADR